MVQKAIADNFSDCTVLTIAHRLNTIIGTASIYSRTNMLQNRIKFYLWTKVEWLNLIDLLRFLRIQKGISTVLFSNLARMQRASFIKWHRPSKLETKIWLAIRICSSIGEYDRLDQPIRGRTFCRFPWHNCAACRAYRLSRILLSLFNSNVMS